jgi:type IV secretion system protein VirB11
LEPGKVGLKRYGDVTWHSAPELDYGRLEAIATLAASMTGQDVSRYVPRCSTILPSDERIDYRVQATLPPLAREGMIELSIRKRATDFVPTLEWLADRGYFDALEKRDWPSYWRGKVEACANIMIGGNTGSSKSTFMEALSRAIPEDERVITIEKTPELELPHTNWSALYYGYAGDGERSERAAVLCVEDSLRMAPDRILFGELRSGGEAWAYLRALMAGHPGGIATIHSLNAAGVYDAFGLMMAQDSSGGARKDEHIQKLVKRYVGVVAHCAKKPYRVTEILESDEAW